MERIGQQWGFESGQVEAALAATGHDEEAAIDRPMESEAHSREVAAAASTAIGSAGSFRGQLYSAAHTSIDSTMHEPAKAGAGWQAWVGFPLPGANLEYY